MKLIPFLFFFIGACFWGRAYPAFCKSDTLCYRFYFPVGSSSLDLSYRNNGLCLDSLLSCIRSRQEHSVLRSMVLYSGASLEGNTALNKRLSEERLKSLRAVIQARLPVADSLFSCFSAGENWEALSSLIQMSDMPYRDEALRIIRDTPVWVIRNGVVVDSRKRQLMILRGGKVWNYMNRHFFPELRNVSVVECKYDSVFTEKDEIPVVAQEKEIERIDTVVLRDTVRTEIVLRDTVQNPVYLSPETPKSFYVGLKTNLIYDALLVPNIGLEFYIGDGWSVGGNWMYAWWNNDRRHFYWRVYGGEIGLRKYWGTRAAGKPLSGHHIGFYGQMLTYDFEFGNRGYIGGRPGGSLWDKSNYGGGIEYGYSLPITRKLNLDFSLGVGYLGGTYYTYTPLEGRYVYKDIKKCHWFGPTKIEVSLVWLLGRGNYNEKKGRKL